MRSNAAANRTATERLNPASRGPVFARAVGTYVPKLTHKAFEKYGFAAAALITDWPTIVGRDIAAYTAPERLKWPRGVGIHDDVEEDATGRPGATLIVRVEPARALDAQYKAQQIIERINVHFGYRAVAELRILQAPLPQRAAPVAAQTPQPVVASPVLPELSGIADDRLRTALVRLQSGLMGRGQRR
jgi:hypothetical protein